MGRLSGLNCKILFAILTLSAVAVTASAQRSYDPQFYLGAKGGVTLGQTSFTPSVRQGWLMGETFGLVARYTEEKVFGLQAELNMEQRGWKEDFQDDRFTYERTLTYIQLPVMTHIYFGRKVKGFVNLGPTVSFLAASSINSNFDYSNPRSVEGFPIHNRMTEQMAMKISNRFDYGIVGGAGMELRVARRHAIMLEARYYFGIGNIFSSARRDVFSASRTSSIMVTLGYMFRVR